MSDDPKANDSFEGRLVNPGHTLEVDNDFPWILNCILGIVVHYGRL